MEGRLQPELLFKPKRLPKERSIQGDHSRRISGNAADPEGLRSDGLHGMGRRSGADCWVQPRQAREPGQVGLGEKGLAGMGTREGAGVGMDSCVDRRLLLVSS